MTNLPLPLDLRIPPSWNLGFDNGRMVVAFPSRSGEKVANHILLVHLHDGKLECDCDGYRFRGECFHVNAFKWVLTGPKKAHKKGIQKTSLDAWAYIQESIGDKQRLVLETLKVLEHATDKMISVALGWPINCITPRRGELVEMGLVEFSHEALDPDTQRTVIVWKPVE